MEWSKITYYDIAINIKMIDIMSLSAAEFAYNPAISEDFSMSPFDVDLGWMPKSLYDLLNKL